MGGNKRTVLLSTDYANVVDPKTKKYKPFQEISQRIKRKYDIEKMAKELPVEVNAFDLLYYNGEVLVKEPFEKRTKLLRKIIKNKKYHLKAAEQFITSDEKEAEKFYKKIGFKQERTNWFHKYSRDKIK